MFSQLLQEAAEKTARVRLMPGQRVQVVSPESGEVVIEGNLETVDDARKVVMVRSVDGTDMTVQVDTTRYEIWVHTGEATIKQEPREKYRNIRPSRPGPYVGGRFGV